MLLLLAACGDATEDLGYLPAEFAVSGAEAEMTGIIDGTTPGRVLQLFADHPEVDTIVMVDVLGSADDEANLEAALLVRDRGVTMVVPADGEIASGGTDFFAAGKRRIVESGAFVGVHSWAGVIDGREIEGGDLPRDDPERRWCCRFGRVGPGIDSDPDGMASSGCRDR